jgi:hypothetical protein
MKIKKGSVVYVMHHDNKISRLIAWFMRDKRYPTKDWSHSAFVVDSTEDEAWLSETTDLEISYGRLSRYINDPNCSVEIYEIDSIEEDLVRDAIKNADTRVGSIYAYWQLFSWALVCLLAKIKIDVPNWLPIGWVCNSHVLECIVIYEKEPFKKLVPQSIHTMRMNYLMGTSFNWCLVYSKDASK